MHEPRRSTPPLQRASNSGARGRFAILALALLISACNQHRSHSSVEADPDPEPLPEPVPVSPPTGAQPRLLRGPFLAETTGESVVVVWITDTRGVPHVLHGLDGGPQAVSGGISSGRNHAVEVRGLSPGQSYRYQVLVNGWVLGGSVFRAFPEASDPQLRFVAFGDSGTGGEDQRRVADRARDAAPDLVIHTGDVIYNRGEPENFDPNYFIPYRDLIDHIPFFTSLGNHDIATNNGQPYLDAFHLPHNNPSGSERYYSFEAAGALFIALDSNISVRPGTAMREWFEDEVQKPAGWKFVFFHEPVFSSGPHGTTDMQMRELEPVFLAGGVDVVFSGHDHVYERTFPLRDSRPVNVNQEPHYLNPAGVVYVVTGGGGRDLYQKESDNDFTAFFASVHHLTRVDLQGRTLSLTAVRDDGREIDSMTITK